MTRKGQETDENSLGNWTAYLEKHQKWIERGFQFTRLAVQEPYGVMILQVCGSSSIYSSHLMPSPVLTKRGSQRPLVAGST